MKIISLILLLLVDNVLSKDLNDEVSEKTRSKLKREHDKEDKSEEEQADYDKEVLFGGDESYEKIHDLTDEEQQEKLREFIVTRMDANSDGFIDSNELLEYTLNSMKEMHKREMNEEFHELDKDKSGDISWGEFNLPVEGEMSDEEKKEHEKHVEEEKKMFQAADKNGDGSLDEGELDAYRHPSMTKETKIAFENKVLQAHDTNKDGAISEDEFLEVMKKNSDHEEDDHESWIEYEREQFKEKLDSDKDGVLKGDELLKLTGSSSVEEKAKKEAEHLMHECDQNQDGKLTSDEIIENHQIWLHTEATDFGRRLNDEL